MTLLALIVGLAAQPIAYPYALMCSYLQWRHGDALDALMASAPASTFPSQETP